jgi:predicted chitinase
MIDHRTFVESVRPTLFGGRVSAAQTAGLRNILSRWEALALSPDQRWLAYALATAHHETARTMRPIRERGGRAYLRRMYDVTGERPKTALRNGNTTPGDGLRYAGRGYVQLTWRNNYRFAGSRLGIDLIGVPDRALEPVVAADILLVGMAEGWFTGRRLTDYFNSARADWLNARRIVNGRDKAAAIRDLALAYHEALQRASGAPAAQKAARTAPRSASGAKAQGPRATNSTPVRASTPTAARSGA